LRVLEKRLLRRTVQPERDYVTADWRNLYCNLYSSRNIIRMIKSRTMMGYVAGMGEIKNAYKILVGKSEEKRPLKRHRCRWEDNIKIHLKETEWEGVEWIHLAQDMERWRGLVNTVINPRVP
jgi:hypothetical protein